MIIISEKNPVIKLFASDRNQIEGDAIRQLEKTAELPGMQEAAGLPDLHPGKGGPIGAAFLSRDIFYPYLVGSDAGCGMGLWKTNLKKNKVKRDKWAKKLSGLESPWEGDRTEWLSKYNVTPSGFDEALGTIGGGNHFAELQIVEHIKDQDIFDKLNLNKNNLMVLVHSGSRGFGASLMRRHTDVRGAQGLVSGSDEALRYLEEHDYALRWAAANRALIAHRFISGLGAKGEAVLDILHNGISRMNTETGELWLHRKGAVPSDQGPIIIPDTRGTFTYLVSPQGEQAENIWSLAHGAGRKWNRRSTKQRLKSKYNAKSFLQTNLGGMVICDDRDLLYEEAPQAYKNIERVIQEMENHGLIRIIAVLKPLITYKMRKES